MFRLRNILSAAAIGLTFFTASTIGQTRDSGTTIRSLLFRDVAVMEGDVDFVFDLDRATGSSYVISSNGELIGIKTGTNSVTWYSADGTESFELSLPGVTKLIDILLVNDTVYVLGTTEDGGNSLVEIAPDKSIRPVTLIRGTPLTILSDLNDNTRQGGTNSVTEAVAPSNTYPYRNFCPRDGGRGVVDPWKFYRCECTSYSAWKLNERGVPFSNTYRLPSGKRWSNASNWKTAAGQAGISVDMNPRRGDVVWFTYGHVGYVESVTKSGSTVVDIVMTEYNYSPAYSFGIRIIPKSQFSTKKIGGFIHF